MEQVAQKTAVNSESSAAASQELDSQAGSLNEVLAGP
jgi:methyl-accepting chemotaxis protein